MFICSSVIMGQVMALCSTTILIKQFILVNTKNVQVKALKTFSRTFVIYSQMQWKNDWWLIEKLVYFYQVRSVRFLQINRFFKIIFQFFLIPKS